jgi:serine/threonine-protein kinase HipA
MQSLEVVLSWGDEDVPVGTLAAREHRIYFEYAPSFLADPLPLSPFKLPVRAGVFEHTERDFAALFGVFNDSLPDGWGLLLMDREFRKRGLDPAAAPPRRGFARSVRLFLAREEREPHGRSSDCRPGRLP